MKTIEGIDTSNTIEISHKIYEVRRLFYIFLRKYEFNYTFKTIYDYDIFRQQRYYEMPYHHDNGHMKKDYITSKCNLEVI